MSKRKVQPTGYWTFFVNPKEFDVTSMEKYFYYLLTEGHERDVKEDQLGVLRVGIDQRNRNDRQGREKLRSGVYALIKICGKPEQCTKNGRKRWRVEICITKKSIKNPLYLPYLETVKGFNDKYILKGFQGSTMPLQERAFNIIRLDLGNKDTLLSFFYSKKQKSLGDVEELEKAYSKSTPEERMTVSKVIERGTLANKFKVLANFECLVCEALGLPQQIFTKQNGQKYIEVHHVMPISKLERGSLGFANLITVCPNHHRQIHYGRTKVKILKDKFCYEIDGEKFYIKKYKIK